MTGIDTELDDAHKRTTIRVLHSDKEFTVPNSSISPINKPEPSDILQHPGNTNNNAIANTTTQDKLKKYGRHLLQNLVKME